MGADTALAMQPLLNDALKGDNVDKVTFKRGRHLHT